MLQLQYWCGWQQWHHVVIEGVDTELKVFSLATVAASRHITQKLLEMVEQEQMKTQGRIVTYRESDRKKMRSSINYPCKHKLREL